MKRNLKHVTYFSIAFMFISTFQNNVSLNLMIWKVLAIKFNEIIVLNITVSLSMLQTSICACKAFHFRPNMKWLLERSEWAVDPKYIKLITITKMLSMFVLKCIQSTYIIPMLPPDWIDIYVVDRHISIH